MQRSYKIVEIDCKVSGRVPDAYRNDPAILRALENVTYTPLLRNWRLAPSASLFPLEDGYNGRLLSAYLDMAHQAYAIAPCGEFHFDRIYSVGYDGLLVDIDNGVAFIGHGLNWSREYFNWWIQNSDVGFQSWNGADGFVADFGEVEREDDNIVLMKSPGYGIYGHWLLDFVPQLLLTRYMGLAADTRFVFAQVSEWMKTLLDVMGIKNHEAYHNRLTSHRQLRKPSGLKCGYAMAEPINGMAWNELRSHFNHLNCQRPASDVERLFISRKKWAGQRSLADYSQLEGRMESLGFTVFHPERYDLSEQAHVFSNARLIVGEDGSGLHSVMLTNPGALLGVLILPDRSNLWHAAICDTMGHRVAFHELAGGTDAGEQLDIAGIERFVGALEGLRV